MILLAQAEAVFQCPVNRLYSLVTNMENYRDWFPGVADIVSGNTLAHGMIGKEYKETLELPTGRETLTITVKQARTNHHFITEGDLEPMLPRMEMKFQNRPQGGCQFHLAYYSRNTELDTNDLLITTLRKDLGERIVVAMKRLRELIEA